MRHRPALGQRQRVSRCAGGHHPDDLRGQAQCVARRDQAAGARTQADGHVHRVQAGRGRKQLQRATGHAGHQIGMERRHQVPAALLGQRVGMLARGLKVIAKLDQLGTQCPHRGVFLAAVAQRHDDQRGHAVATGGKSDRLAVVAPGGADDTGRQCAGCRQPVEINQPAANLEGPHRRVVLMLEPELGAVTGLAGKCGLQQRPAVLRRGRHHRVHGAGGGLQGGQRKAHGAGSRPPSRCSRSTRPMRATPSAMSAGASVTKLSRSVRPLSAWAAWA